MSATPTHPTMHSDSPDRVLAVRGPADRVVVGGAQPEGDQRGPHHEVADEHDVEVAVLEGARHAGGEDQHADHLHEHEQPVDDVVVVVRRREPREVHPRPPDGEEHEHVADDRVSSVAVADVVVEQRRRPRDGDDEAEVVEQLERGRRPVLLRRVARPHRSAPGTRHGRRR